MNNETAHMLRDDDDQSSLDRDNHDEDYDIIPDYDFLCPNCGAECSYSDDNCWSCDEPLDEE